jgi:hypothetical protein
MDAEEKKFLQVAGIKLQPIVSSLCRPISSAPLQFPCLFVQEGKEQSQEESIKGKKKD